MNCPLCNKEAKSQSKHSYDIEEYLCVCEDFGKQWITFRISQKRQIYAIRIGMDNLRITSFIGTQIFSSNGDSLYYQKESLTPLEALKRFKKLMAFS